MSDDATKTAAPEASADETQGEEAANALPTDRDWFLCELAQMVNTIESFEVGLTVTTGGLLVSGVLIGGGTYFRLFGESFAPLVPKSRDEVAEVFAGYGQLYDAQGEPPESPGTRPEYIHMRDVRFFHPGGALIPGGRGVLWRGRLAAVEGFTLGYISSDGFDR